jgi:hypothetical protein
MVLIRNLVEVQYGHFAEVLRGYEELNEICRSRGWKPAALRVKSGGRANYLTADCEYDSLDQWQQESEAAYGDPEFMKVYRSCGQYCVQGTGREEIWTDAPHLA